MVGGFEALTAMENVESDPKTDKPKVLGASLFFPSLETFVRLKSGARMSLMEQGMSFCA